MKCKSYSLIFDFLFFNLLRGEEGKHLFILSGQSNMQGHRPDEASSQREKGIWEAKCDLCSGCLGGQPIHRWWKEWLDPQGNKPEQSGDLYNRLMSKVKPAIKGQSW